MPNRVVVQFFQTLSICKNQHIFPLHSKQPCTRARQLLWVKLQCSQNSHCCCRCCCSPSRATATKCRFTGRVSAPAQLLCFPCYSYAVVHRYYKRAKGMKKSCNLPLLTQLVVRGTGHPLVMAGMNYNELLVKHRHSSLQWVWYLETEVSQ